MYLFTVSMALTTQDSSLFFKAQFSTYVIRRGNLVILHFLLLSKQNVNEYFFGIPVQQLIE